MNEEFEAFWKTTHQTIGKVAAKAAWDEQANRRRKDQKAQMLMNAAALGNRNYLAEIENLTEAVSKYKPYYDAIDNATVVAHLGTAESLGSANEALNALLMWTEKVDRYFQRETNE